MRRVGSISICLALLFWVVGSLAPAPLHAQAPTPSMDVPSQRSAVEPQVTQPRARSGAISVEPQLHDLSPWRMFMGADIVVKGVMIGLAFASVVTWTVFLAKSAEIALSKRRLSQALRDLGSVISLDEAPALPSVQRTVVSDFLQGAGRELSLSGDLARLDGAKERIASVMAEITRSEGAAIRKGMGLLATIGSTAPFVGLFGTVWGIMNSFIGISKSQTTNLAVVAPGIAEALLATAIGLVAAIPAVIFYNHFSRGTKAYLELVARASGEVVRLVSRDIDRREQVGASIRGGA